MSLYVTDRKTSTTAVAIPHVDAFSIAAVGLLQELGRNCHMPNALQTPVQAVLHHEWLTQQRLGQDDLGGLLLSSLPEEAKQEVFVAAVRDVLASGGCCASRASFAGACLGALLGPEGVPDDWVSRSDAGEKVKHWAHMVCSARSS